MPFSRVCDRADECRASLYRLLGGEYPGDARMSVVLRCFDVVTEHHEAIVQLVRSRLYGSAYSFVRVIVEACHRGHWLARCASEAQIARLIRGKLTFPPAKEMAKAVDKALETGGLYTELLDDGRWDAMNDYTHTGTRQLSRRSVGTKIQPNYSAEEVLSVIAVSTGSMLMFGRLLAILGDRRPAADQIEEMIINFDTVLK